MQKLIFLLIICFNSVFFFAQEKKKIPYINTAFEAGEILKYKVQYGIIKGGEASMSINIVPNGDSYLYHIKAIAETVGVVGAMVTIRDIYESYIEIPSGLPVKSVRNILEHKYTYYDEYNFFRDSNYVETLNAGRFDVPEHIHDVLSAFYYARRYLFSNKLQKNQVIPLKAFFDEKIYDLDVKYKNTEIIKTKFGKIKCLRFVPATNLKGTFEKEDQMQIWVTADENYVPVKIRVKLPIGKLKCDLIDYQGLKNRDGELPTLKKSKH